MKPNKLPCASSQQPAASSSQRPAPLLSQTLPSLNSQPKLAT